jgi:TonB-dependent starch-binding outer membrane protein SusC
VGFLNRDQYLSLFQEAFNNVADENGILDLGSIRFDSYEDALDWGLTHWRSGADVNWEDQALRNGAHTQFDLSAAGGTETTQFYASLTYLDQLGIIRGNQYDRIGGRLNLDQSVSERLAFGMNMNLTRTRNFRVANDNAFATPLQMVALPPVDPTHDPESGELNRRTVYANGLLPLEYSNFDTEIFRNLGTIFMNWELLNGLTFRSEAGVDILNQREMEYRGRLTNDGGPDGFAFDRSVTSKIYNLENYLVLNVLLGELFDMNLVGGTSFQLADFDFASMTATGFPNDQFRRIASASDITGASSSGTGYRYISYFSRANLKFMNNYLVTLSGRLDGSSRFGADNRYGFFPAVSAGWIMSNEPFLQNNNVMSFLKPRISWGITGNSEIDDFAARGLYMGTNYAGLSGMRPASMASPDLRWETTQQLSVGIDFGFFNNRITGEFDYYQKHTTDLLLNVQVPATTGYTSVYRNVGELTNRGFEFVINTVNVDRAFQWNTSFNIAFNRNEVTNLDGQIIQQGIWRVMEGQPIGVFYTKEYAGVDPDTGDALFYLNEEGDETTTSLAAAANRIVGDPNPDFFGGLTNTFRFMGFDLNVFFQFVYGNDVFNGGRQWQADGLSWFDNQTLDFYENYWREPGDNARYPQPRWLFGNGYGVSSMLIFDGSYIRMKELSLGYNFPAQWLSNMGVQNLRIFARAYNLLTFTDYPGWDPEANFQGTDVTNQSANIIRGRDFYTAPQPRTITFGINLTL